MTKISTIQRIVLSWINARKKPVTVAQLYASKPMGCLFQASDIMKALIFLQTKRMVLSEKRGAETVWFKL